MLKLNYQCERHLYSYNVLIKIVLGGRMGPNHRKMYGMPDAKTRARGWQLPLITDSGLCMFHPILAGQPRRKLPIHLCKIILLMPDLFVFTCWALIGYSTRCTKLVRYPKLG